MKKIFTQLMLLILLLLSACADSGKANFTIVKDGGVVEAYDMSYIVRDDVLKIPIYVIEDNTEIIVDWESGQSEAVLKSGDIVLELIEEEKIYTLNGITYSLGSTPELKDDMFYIPTDILRLLNYSVETDNKKQVEVTYIADNVYEEMTQQIVDYLLAGEYDKCYELFTDSLKERMEKDEIEIEWEFNTEELGKYKSIHDYVEFFRTDNEEVVCESDIYLNYDLGSINLRVRYLDDKIDRIFFFNGNKLLPKNVTEEDLIIGEETAFPLGATLTLPEGDGPFKSVILVHGSGDGDRDLGAYGSKPFRDIAWGLAEQGIAVLRYDKRTNVYSDEYSSNPDLTVQLETIEDVLLATELLKADSRIQDVSILGHSLGGSLAAVIDQKGADFASIISFAGTLRPLWEVGIEQMVYFYTIATDEKVAQNYKERYEYMKGLGNLLDMDDTIAKSTLLSETYLYYYKDFMKYDLFEYARTSNKPFLILQGSSDFQVSPDIDFNLWKETLKDNANAEFILYDNVNHIFMESPEDNKGTVEEYTQQISSVPDYIINDIANFIKK